MATLFDHFTKPVSSGIDLLKFTVYPGLMCLVIGALLIGMGGSLNDFESND